MKIRKHIEAIKQLLSVEEAKRAIGRIRTKKFHKQQETVEAQAKKAHDEADRLNQEATKCFGFGNGENQAKGERLYRRSRRKTKKAIRLEGTATKKNAKKIYWRDVAKKASQKINKLDASLAAAEKELKKWEATHGPHIDTNTRRVVGTTDKGEAARYAATYAWHKCAEGSRPNFYSMSGGGFNISHCVAKGTQSHIGQQSGERSDCSVFVTEVCWAAGLPDPNGTNFGSGYTGTLQQGNNGWRQVSYQEMIRHGWGFTIYGGGTGHHTEFYIGNGMTIGHGSSPVDPGVPDLFGDGDFRCYIYDPK